VSIASNENLGDLNNELAKLFASGGLTVEKLHEMVMSMPPIQQLLAQAPQLQDMMKQAFAAMAAKVETPAPAQPKKTLQKTPAIKNPFKPEGLTFERFYKMQSPN
ncbi:MAG: hypothetical protein L6Q71_07470, partial [Planctomycetes bacterium]|nr:hypothetical protein [Planctomycetota bacterium]